MEPFVERALELLRRDGRASFSDLATALGTHRMNVATRIGPLLESGSIRVIAAVHPGLLGLQMLAHVSLRTFGPPQPIVDALSGLSPVVFMSETTGAYQFIAEVHTRHIGELQEAVHSIRAIPGVIEANTLIYERVFTDFFLGEGRSELPVTIDEQDLQLIDMLQLDGRTSYTDLAKAVGLSTSAARARVKRLIDAGAMRIGVVRGRNSAGSELVFGFGVGLSGEHQPVVDVLEAQPGIEFLARTVGRYDIVATIAFSKLADYNALSHQLRELPEVRTVDSWLHAKIHHERYLHGVQ